MIIDNSLKKELKDNLEEYIDNKANARAFDRANTELIRRIAESLGMKKNSVRDAFRYAHKKVEKGEDNLSEIVDIFETMKE